MSIKSERRVWYAANVEAKPAGEIAGSPTYMSWVKRANAYMVAACIPGTSELRPEIVAEFQQPKPVKVAGSGRRIASLVAPSKDDREAFEAHKSAQLHAIGHAMEWPGEEYDDLWLPQRFGADAIVRPNLEFCKGSWKIAQRHMRPEIVRLHDEGVWQWITFTEFRAMRALDRQQEAIAVEEIASFENCIEDGLCELCEPF